MTIILSVWTNIKDEQKATNIFKDLFKGSTFTQTKSEIYWKDETKRVLTFISQADTGSDLKTRLFKDLNLISSNLTLNIDGLVRADIEINGHSNDNFTHSSISFATVINE